MCIRDSVGGESLINDELASRGIIRAVENGTQVINMSFANDGQPDVYASCSNSSYSLRCVALHHASERGVSIVAAAGNNANFNSSGTQQHSDLRSFPAIHPKVMAVSGLQLSNAGTAQFWTGVPNFGSNFGTVNFGIPQISLAAPAASIMSTAYTNFDWNPGIVCGDSYGGAGAGYGWCTGTSMAAPHVSAAAALVKSANPLLGNDAVRAALTSTAECLGSSGLPCATDAEKQKQGYGVPNVGKAVLKALGNPNAVNRATPLFSHARLEVQGGQQFHKSHFYTAVPQMSMAAIAGTA
jgi:serine protease